MTKGPLALRTISETADQIGVQQHVLRFWETKFPFIRPTKRAGGRRFYRPQDIDLLMGVKTLLYDRGYTIRGVQMLFKEQGQKAILAASGEGGAVAIAPEGEDDSTTAPKGLSAYGFDDDPDGSRARILSEETRERFLNIARALEEAQEALGRQIGRHGRGLSRR